MFARGAQAVEACAAAGIPVEVVPSVTSATVAPALAGIPLRNLVVLMGIGQLGMMPADFVVPESKGLSSARLGRLFAAVSLRDGFTLRLE